VQQFKGVLVWLRVREDASLALDGSPELPGFGIVLNLQGSPCALCLAPMCSLSGSDETGAQTQTSCLRGMVMEKVNLAEKLNLFSEHWSPKIVGELNRTVSRLEHL
jgi:hypothetical protein